MFTNEYLKLIHTYVDEWIFKTIFFRLPLLQPKYWVFMVELPWDSLLRDVHQEVALVTSTHTYWEVMST